MTDAEVIAALDDRQTLGLTMYGEARGIPRNDPRDHSPVEELIAVACVVRNRRAHFSEWRAADNSWKAICLASNQFSCWNPASGANHNTVLAQARLLVETNPVIGSIDPEGRVDTELRECLYLADGVIANTIIDRTGGARQYWAPNAMVPPGRVPSWAVGKQTLLIGDQLFLQA
jgi:hypothetical protein